MGLLEAVQRRLEAERGPWLAAATAERRLERPDGAPSAVAVAGFGARQKGDFVVFWGKAPLQALLTSSGGKVQHAVGPSAAKPDASKVSSHTLPISPPHLPISPDASKVNRNTAILVVGEGADADRAREDLRKLNRAPRPGAVPAACWDEAERWWGTPQPWGVRVSSHR